jgi:hypothetical protein
VEGVLHGTGWCHAWPPSTPTGDRVPGPQEELPPPPTPSPRMGEGMGGWLLGVLLAEGCGQACPSLGGGRSAWRDPGDACPTPSLLPLGAQAGPVPCATSCSAMSWEVGGGGEGGVVVVVGSGGCLCAMPYAWAGWWWWWWWWERALPPPHQSNLWRRFPLPWLSVHE